MGFAASAIVLTIAAACGWSLLDLLRRFLAGHLEALSLVAWVTAGAVPPLVVWAAVAGAFRFEAGYLAPAAASVAINVLANFAYFRALQLSPLSQTLPMLSFTPAFAALFGALFLGERMDARGFVGMLAVIGGALLLTLRPGRGFAGLVAGLAGERGAGVMIGVAFLWAATLLLDKRAIGHAPVELHALVLNAGVAVGALAALAANGRLARLGAIRGHVPLLLGTVGVSAAALSAQLFALGEVPLGFLETVKRGFGGALAVLWGRLFFAEAVSGTKLVAVAAMTLGVALLVL